MVWRIAVEHLPARKPVVVACANPAMPPPGRDFEMKLFFAVLAVAALAAVALTGFVSASGLTETRVTINVEGRDYFGKVKSPRQRCVNERKVKLIKQKGERGGGDDIKIASDLADEAGEWSTGNTGSRGRHYARAPRIPGKCKGDSSRTLRTEF
jgi:hypothetical protein